MSYTLRQWCRARGDFRIPQIVEYLKLMKEAFHISDVYDEKNKAVALTIASLRKIVKHRIREPFPEVGATFGFFSIPPDDRDDDTVRFEFHTGTSPEPRPYERIDTYDISIGDARLVPDLTYFKLSVLIFRPFEAFVEESKNEIAMNTYERMHATRDFSSPDIIRGFHYLDEGMARSIGGIDFCLGAPAWKVERFCDGVLIRLVPGLFDNNSVSHRRIQHEAMKYFNIL